MVALLPVFTRLRGDKTQLHLIPVQIAFIVDFCFTPESQFIRVYVYMSNNALYWRTLLDCVCNSFEKLFRLRNTTNKKPLNLAAILNYFAEVCVLTLHAYTNSKQNLVRNAYINTLNRSSDLWPHKEQT